MASLVDYSELKLHQNGGDLTGFYTRSEMFYLFLQTDSKYVITNAGDEITMEFDAGILPSWKMAGKEISLSAAWDGLKTAT